MVHAASAGLGFIQFCNLNSFRTKFIVGFSLFMGLSIPQYFNEKVIITGHGPVHTGARWVRILKTLVWLHHHLIDLYLVLINLVFILSPLLAVQLYNASDLYLRCNNGSCGCIFLGLYTPPWGQRNSER